LKKKRKVCVVITARASYSRIKSAMVSIKNHPDLTLQVIITASALLDKYGSIKQYLKNDNINVTSKVYMVIEGENLASMAKTTGTGINELASIFDNIKPDVVVTVADRYETISTAIAASFMQIPLVHIQGGEVTGNIDEKVRHAVTKLADFHFVSTKLAKSRVIKLGEDSSRVFLTGCPSIDIAEHIVQNGSLDFDPISKYGGVGPGIDINNGYIVVLQHPVTDEYELAGDQISKTLSAIYDSGYPCFWFWPNIDAGSNTLSNAIRSFREENEIKNIHFFKSMSPEDFLKLIYNSKMIVGNSSVAIRECSYLGVPAVNIGSRQLGREHSDNVVNVNYDIKQIKTAIKGLWNSNEKKCSNLYGHSGAGKKIAELLSTIQLTTVKKLTY
jgi:UDP-hydrolysing UDP-N-acetyl-D-glucosamine 2-epimerase